MDRNKLIPERIISGFFHFAWLILLIFILLGVRPEEIIDYLKVLSSGTAALIASIILGASFFLGNLFDRVIIDVVNTYCKLRNISQKPISELNQLQNQNSDELLDLKNSYIDKAFFRSICFSGIFLIPISLWWNCISGASPGVYYSILVIGLIIEILTLRVFLVLRNHYNEVFDKINKSN